VPVELGRLDQTHRSGCALATAQQSREQLV
jgi:hypothetical protein